MALWLKAPITIAEGLGLIPSTHIGADPPILTSRGTVYIFLLLILYH